MVDLPQEAVVVGAVDEAMPEPLTERPDGILLGRARPGAASGPQGTEAGAAEKAEKFKVVAAIVVWMRATPGS
jgi:hypothetical protein